MPEKALLERLEMVGDEIDYLSHHTRSFRHVVRIFSPRAEGRLARAYAYCRFMDDLVDDPALAGNEAGAMLEAWIDLSRRAYSGDKTGVALLDEVMSDMRAAGVPFRYAEELAEGMRMDLRGQRYKSMGELETYTHRVASVVGLWIAELFGVHDPVALDHAARLGHALQLTNIIRDVGDDLRIGRCYLPADMMLRHGVTEAQLVEGARSPGYATLIDEMIRASELAFDESMGGLDHIPRIVRVPIAVAVHVYRGLLGEIRRNGYDNLGRRAELSLPRMVLLAGRGMIEAGTVSLRRHVRDAAGDWQLRENAT